MCLSHERPLVCPYSVPVSLIHRLLQCQRFFSPDCRRKSTPQAGCATKWQNELTPTIQYIQQPHDVFILSVRFLHPHRDVSFCFAQHSLCIQRQRTCSALTNPYIVHTAFNLCPLCVCADENLVRLPSGGWQHFGSGQRGLGRH